MSSVVGVISEGIVEAKGVVSAAGLSSVAVL